MKVSFCPGCGRIVLRGFNYCPYCGIAQAMASGLAAAASLSFERLERRQADSRDRHIAELMERLDGIEYDVELMLNGIADTDKRTLSR